MTGQLSQDAILCTICARGGSKGVPGKNTRLMMGKPLMAYTIDQARQSQLFKYIAVSSDSPEILRVAKELGVDVLVERPPELATDQAAKIPVIQHCFLAAEKKLGMKFAVDVDLDVTSPLRLPEDIRGSVELLYATGAKNVITGMTSRHSPYFNMVETQPSGFVELAKKNTGAIVRRQDAPKTYDMNGSVYVWTRDSLLNCTRVIEDRTVIYEMPAERSADIDSPLDWQFVEFLMKNKTAK